MDFGVEDQTEIKPAAKVRSSDPRSTVKSLVIVLLRQNLALTKSTASLAKTAMQTGCAVRFDSRKQRFIGDKDANSYIHQPMRGPGKA